MAQSFGVGSLRDRGTVRLPDNLLCCSSRAPDAPLAPGEPLCAGGIICALLNNAVVIVMDHAGYRYAVGLAAAFLVAALVGYLLHTAYTFGVPASPLGWLRFTGANLLGLPISMALMFLLCDGAGLKAWMAMPIATVLVFALNFALARCLFEARSRAQA